MHQADNFAHIQCLMAAISKLTSTAGDVESVSEGEGPTESKAYDRYLAELKARIDDARAQMSALVTAATGLQSLHMGEQLTRVEEQLANLQAAVNQLASNLGQQPLELPDQKPRQQASSALVKKQDLVLASRVRPDEDEDLFRNE